MKTWLKITFGLLAAAGMVIAIGVGVFWYLSGQPLYEPGMVRAGKNLRASLTPPQQSTDEQFWKVEDDIQLYHFAHGAGRPVLVIHGGPGLPDMKPWPGLEALANEYQFVYYHQRGSGQSTRPIDTFTSQNYSENLATLDKTLGLGAQIADIERIRQILGQERLIVVGHSFGGFLASLYAAEFPEYVEALILIAPAEVLVMPAKDGGLFEQVKQRLPTERRAEFEAYLKDYLNFGNIFQKSEADLIVLNERFGEFYAAVAPVPELEAGRSGGWMVQAMYFSMGQRHDYRPALTPVSAPVLVIHGANDLQPEAASRVYAEAFPNATFEVIAEAAHFPFAEQPEVFALLVEQFLSTLPNGGG
jgi:proline iminopeptidase